MKNFSSIFCALLLVLGACTGNDDDELIFEQTADERVEAAIADLQQRLVAPANGWVMRYQPVPESGAYNVLFNFNGEGRVRIRTDFGVNDGEFYDQTVTYRVDNSLGLELILETYSFFSYLFEQNQATFEAEYEFNYVNETPEGDLVFSSKTDLAALTVVALEPAPENAESLLGRQLNDNLEALSSSLGVISPVYRLDFANRDLSLFLSFNTNLRTLSFTYAADANGLGRTINDFSTGYIVQGNSLILGTPLTGNFLGSDITISAIDFSELADGGSVDACDQPVSIQQYRGAITDSGAPVALLPTLFDPAGAAFAGNSGTYLANPSDIYFNGQSIGNQLSQDVDGAIGLVIYNFDREEDPFVAIGFGIVEEELIVPVRAFDPTYTDNQIAFNLSPEYSIAIGDTTAIATLDTTAMNTYISNLTEGDNTRILQSAPGVYELYNPCTGWSAILRRL